MADFCGEEFIILKRVFIMSRKYAASVRFPDFASNAATTIRSFWGNKIVHIKNI